MPIVEGNHDHEAGYSALLAHTRESPVDPDFLYSTTTSWTGLFTVNFRPD